MSASVLITGVNGFCGRHLAAHLSAAGYGVAGLDRDRGLPLGPDFYQADVTDAKALQAILEAARPDIVFHLAALLNPRLPYDALHQVNVLGTLSLLDAVRTVCPRATVMVTSTSAVYGRVRAEELPIAELQPFRPSTPYAVTKIAQEMLAYQQFATHGLRVVRARTFNLVGPGESPAFASSAFARQIAEIELGRRDPVLAVGNLESVRDFTDVRDAVRAYRLLAEVGEPGSVFNVCSGRGTPIAQVLDTLLSLSRVRGVAVKVDPTRLQPADVPIQIGDPARLTADTGWSAAIDLEQSLADLLEDWRNRVREEKP
ncbi:MAG: GDP-mannose 4,6-dehydratase [Anaerolineae bacterium]|jgi:GDP-4-dehydro-6-deoxy-D-mannose reductase|nr:GDP-mannose 4,6-dehydratase [Anaerolineae bacterium]